MNSTQTFENHAGGNVETNSPLRSTRTRGFQKVQLGSVLAIGSVLLMVAVSYFLGTNVFAEAAKPLIMLLIVGLILVATGIAEAITNKRWAEHRQTTRLLFLVLGIPGFIATCVGGMMLYGIVSDFLTRN